MLHTEVQSLRITLQNCTNISFPYLQYLKVTEHSMLGLVYDSPSPVLNPGPTTKNYYLSTHVELGLLRYIMTFKY